jgi:hypothetical protein
MKQKIIDGKKVISTFEISEILGFIITAKYIEKISFIKPYHIGVGYYWYEEDLPFIFASLASFILFKSLRISKKKLGGK